MAEVSIQFSNGSCCHGNERLFDDCVSLKTPYRSSRNVLLPTWGFCAWWFIATHCIHDLIHTTSSCRLGCKCINENIMSLKWSSSFGNLSPSRWQRALKSTLLVSEQDLWVQYAACLCRAFSCVQTMEHFHGAVPSLFAESVLETQTLSRGERAAELIGLRLQCRSIKVKCWPIGIYKI